MTVDEKQKAVEELKDLLVKGGLEEEHLVMSPPDPKTKKMEGTYKGILFTVLDTQSVLAHHEVAYPVNCPEGVAEELLAAFKRIYGNKCTSCWYNACIFVTWFWTAK